MYGVTAIVRDKIKCVHCARLIKYRDYLHGQQVSKETLDISERKEARYEVAEKTVSLGEARDSPFIHVRREFLSEKHDRICKALTRIREHLNDFFSKFRQVCHFITIRTD